MKRGRPDKLTNLERKLAREAIRDIDRYFRENPDEGRSVSDARPRFRLIRGGKR